jgi:hypothetical protein
MQERTISVLSGRFARGIEAAAEAGTLNRKMLPAPVSQS